MFILLLAFPCFAHPFENEFFGHDVEVTLAGEEISLRYTLEIPLQQLRQSVVSFAKANPELASTAKKDMFIRSQYAEMESLLNLYVNEELVFWDSVAPLKDEIEREGNFTRFPILLSASVPLKGNKITIVNQNQMIETGVFRNTVLTGFPFSLEQIEVADGQWTKEESAREIRLVYLPMGSFDIFFHRNVAPILGLPTEGLLDVDDAIAKSQESVGKKLLKPSGTSALLFFVLCFCNALWRRSSKVQFVTTSAVAIGGASVQWALRGYAVEIQNLALALNLLAIICTAATTTKKIIWEIAIAVALIAFWFSFAFIFFPYFGWLCGLVLLALFQILSKNK